MCKKGKKIKRISKEFEGEYDYASSTEPVWTPTPDKIIESESGSEQNGWNPEDSFKVSSWLLSHNMKKVSENLKPCKKAPNKCAKPYLKRYDTKSGAGGFPQDYLNLRACNFMVRRMSDIGVHKFGKEDRQMFMDIVINYLSDDEFFEKFNQYWQGTKESTRNNWVSILYQMYEEHL